MATKEHGIKQQPAGTMLVYDGQNDKFRLAKGLPDGEVFTTSGISIPEHDYFSIDYNTTFDTITYKVGGSGGTIVATVVVTFTDSSKTAISSVERM